MIHKITHRSGATTSTLLTTQSLSIALDDFKERTASENNHNTSGKCDVIKIGDTLVHICYDKNMGRVRQQYELITLTN